MRNEAITHGLDGRWVQPDWPPLTLDFARRLLAAYPQVGKPQALVSISPRPFSSASVISTDRGPIFIKRHSSFVRNIEGLHEEHRLMRHLLTNGAPVPLVFTAHNGATAFALEDSFGLWSCEVQSVPEGIDLYQNALSWTPFQSTAHAYAAGQALARLHIAAQGYAAPQRPSRPLVSSFTIFAASDPSDALKKYLTSRPALAQFIAHSQSTEQALELLTPYHRELLPLINQLAPLWTHNDLHASNLLWSSDWLTAQATAIIDFGLADRTNCVHDLALTIERNIIEWLTLPQIIDQSTQIRVHLACLHALLIGYQKVRPLSVAEAAALAPMTALCHAEFALSEADYFLSVLHTESKAVVAIDTYLLGHAQWFCTPNGAHLLDAIREAADQTRQSAINQAEEVRRP